MIARDNEGFHLHERSMLNSELEVGEMHKCKPVVVVTSQEVEETRRCKGEEEREMVVVGSCICMVEESVWGVVGRCICMVVEEMVMVVGESCSGRGEEESVWGVGGTCRCR